MSPTQSVQMHMGPTASLANAGLLQGPGERGRGGSELGLVVGEGGCPEAVGLPGVQLQAAPQVPQPGLLPRGRAPQWPDPRTPPEAC